MRIPILDRNNIVGYKYAGGYEDKTNDIQNSINSIVEKSVRDICQKQNQLIMDRISIIEGKEMTVNDVLLINMDDLKAIQYTYDPEWTHYYYKGKRLISLGPTTWSEIRQDKDGSYKSTMTQKYY